MIVFSFLMNVLIPLIDGIWLQSPNASACFLKYADSTDHYTPEYMDEILYQYEF